jgi:hypothetical protein
MKSGISWLLLKISSYTTNEPAPDRHVSFSAGELQTFTTADSASRGPAVNATTLSDQPCFEGIHR